MRLTREEIRSALREWNRSWDRRDLEGVLELFHEDCYFENWTGGNARGKKALREAWGSWFAGPEGFRFKEEDLFIDAEEQKALYRWELSWPSMESGYEGKPEKRRGVDILHFQNGLIIEKLTYCKTGVEIEGKRVRLKTVPP